MLLLRVSILVYISFVYICCVNPSFPNISTVGLWGGVIWLGEEKEEGIIKFFPPTHIPKKEKKLQHYTITKDFSLHFSGLLSGKTAYFVDFFSFI